MHREEVEIYSDETNRAILRHPGRKHPVVLIQGDSLHALCQKADGVCANAKDAWDAESYAKLNELRNSLWAYLTHYKVVLGEHDLPLPFSG
jgi:hypothetical protein